MGAPKGNKYAVGNKGGYGVTKYTPEMDESVFRLARTGLSIAQIAEELGISRPTIDNWRKEHESFCAALDLGRELVDDQVENALFKRALGFSHPDVHITNFQGEVTITPITKHYAPDTGAAKLWLTNRRPEKWRERTEQTQNTTVTLEAGDSIVGLVARIRGMRNVTPSESAIRSGIETEVGNHFTNGSSSNGNHANGSNGHA